MIKIVTDTASDITPAQAEAMDVQLAEIGVIFSGIPFQSDDETFREFYRKLEVSKELPTTSQPSPEAFLDVYNQAKEAGGSVIVITLSSGLSGTYQSATIAKDMVRYDGIHVVDTRSAIIGQRLLVEQAAKMRGEGKSAEEIVAWLEDARERLVLFGALDTLKYLRKGGRIPKSAEMLGTMLGIKPIITINPEGKIELVGKSRGHAGMIAMVIKQIKERSDDFDETTPLYVGYTYEQKLCDQFLEALHEAYDVETSVHPVGAVVGTHIGPGAFAVAYLAKQ
ncbi:MAG: DegV family protein [Christensenellales bacterium]|jgi:DegV family protein with EDD domain